MLAVAGCAPHAPAPVEVGFTGRCKLRVELDRTGLTHSFLTEDEAKARAVLDIVKDVLISIHVEIPDTRGTSSLDKVQDHPLYEGNAKPELVLDPIDPLDLPMQLHSREGGEGGAWQLSVRVRFRAAAAEVVADRMQMRGKCVRPPPPDGQPAPAPESPAQ